MREFTQRLFSVVPWGIIDLDNGFYKIVGWWDRGKGCVRKDKENIGWKLRWKIPKIGG